MKTKSLTKQELKTFIESSTYHDTTDRNKDSCGNTYYSEIYYRGGRYFKLCYINNEPQNKWIDCSGYKSGLYDIHEVQPVNISYTVYEDVE